MPAFNALDAVQLKKYEHTIKPFCVASRLNHMTTCHIADCFSRPLWRFFLCCFANICNMQCHNGYIVLPHTVSPYCDKISSYEMHLYKVSVVNATVHVASDYLAQSSATFCLLQSAEWAV
ncbi:hypothetical protein MTO96_020840 [Rhipicephalus appendiculatus]